MIKPIFYLVFVNSLVARFGPEKLRFFLTSMDGSFRPVVVRKWHLAFFDMSGAIKIELGSHFLGTEATLLKSCI